MALPRSFPADPWGSRHAVRVGTKVLTLRAFQSSVLALAPRFRGARLSRHMRPKCLYPRRATVPDREMIDKLELLLALARERHFGHAAEAAGVTQPTLSAAVKSLEEQLGVLIVERGSRFGGFTPEGERVLEWARRIVGAAQAMRNEIDVLKHGLSGHLRLGVIPTALPVVAGLTTALRSRSEEVSFTVLSLSSDDILSRLANLELDVGVSYIDAEPMGGFDTLPLYEERYALLVSAEAPIAGRNSVSWQEAGDLPLCQLTPDMQNRRLLNLHLKEAGAAPRITLESNSLMLLYAHVRTGAWASIIPVRLAESFQVPRYLKAITLTPSLTHGIGLVLHRRPTLSPLVSAFKDAAKDFAAKEHSTQ